MSTGTALPKQIEAAIEAHGGAARWREASEIEAIVSARGALFTLKHRPVMQRVRVSARWWARGHVRLTCARTTARSTASSFRRVVR